jgi:hypothetical protein
MGMDTQTETLLQEIAEERRSHYFGKYRGIVLEALTGDDIGKLKVSVPDVLQDQPGIAIPCVPFAGPSHGLVAIPEKDDGVWIEFEAGDPSQPIWVGCWWGTGDMPSQAGPKIRTFVTTGGLALVMDDDKNELSLQHPDGPSITLSSDGIKLSTDAATVTLNTQGISLQGNTAVGE